MHGLMNTCLVLVLDFLKKLVPVRKNVVFLELLGRADLHNTIRKHLYPKKTMMFV